MAHLTKRLDTSLAISMQGRPAVNAALWVLVIVAIAANAVAVAFPDLTPLDVEAAVLVLLPFAFLFVHGSADYRFSDTAAFAAICIVVGNVFENLGVFTGFPFGHYHFTDRLGPKLFAVPLVIGPAYAGMGYLSWMLARVILGPGPHSICAVPALASFLMVAWDLSFDPLASTLQLAWIWEQGGSYFGVPLSNFLGWYLTAYVFLQIFALYLEWRGRSAADQQARSRAYWLQPVLLYAATAFRLIGPGIMSAAASGSVTDRAGTVWRIHDLAAVCVLVCLLTMVPFAVLGLMKVAAMPRRPATA